MLEEEVRTASAIVISTRDELNAQIHALTAELDIAKQTKGAESDEKCAELLGMVRAGVLRKAEPIKLGSDFLGSTRI